MPLFHANDGCKAVGCGGMTCNIKGVCMFCIGSTFFLYVSEEPKTIEPLLWERSRTLCESMTQQLVFFNSRDILIRLDISKIVYFEGDGNYSYIVTSNKHKVCVTMNLSHTEEALATQLGCRR